MDRYGLIEYTTKSLLVKFELRWNLISQSSTNNTSLVSWEYRASNIGIEDTEFEELPYEVQIDGVVYTGIANFPFERGASVVIASGTTTLIHAPDGGKTFHYSFYHDISGSGLDFFSDVYATGVSTLPWIHKYAYVTSAPNFTDEDNPTLHYSNPMGEGATRLQACIAVWNASANNWDANAGVPYRDIPKTGTYYTFELTNQERENLIKAIGNTNTTATVAFVIETYYEPDNLIWWNDAQRTVSLVNYNPVLTPSIIDSNPDTVALTGDNSKLIEGYSNAYFTFDATGRKGGTIVSQYAEHNDTRIENHFSGTFEKIKSSGNNLNKAIFTFSATDSRGATTQKKVEMATIPYIPLTSSLSITEFDLFGNLIFTLNGRYFNDSFGAQTNSLEVTYTLKKNGQLVETIALNPHEQGTLTFSENDIYSYNYQITGLTPLEADGSANGYSIQVTIKDRVSDWITTEEITSTAIPVFEWEKEKFTFNVPVHFGRGFTDDTGLKTAVLVRTLSLTAAGSYMVGTLSEMGISSSDHGIYSLTGTIGYENRIYTIPSPPLGSITGTLNIADSVKFWIDGDIIYITVGASWGNAPVRLVIMYF